MILRIACLPLPSEHDSSMGLVLRTTEYPDILGRVSNWCSLHLDTMRVLEHEDGKRDVRIIVRRFNVLVKIRRRGPRNSLVP